MRNSTLKASTAALGLFLLLGAVVAAAPFQQSTPDGQHTHPRYETAIAQSIIVDSEHSTQITMLWGTLDSYAISSMVATLIEPVTVTPFPTNTRRPTSTPLPPASPSMHPTSTTVPLIPTATHTAWWFPTPTQETQPEPTALPPMTYATNISSSARNVRECPATTCDVVAVVLVGETVVINAGLSAEGEGLRWYPLRNGSGWVSVERLNPYERYLSW